MISSCKQNCQFDLMINWFYYYLLIYLFPAWRHTWLFDCRIDWMIDSKCSTNLLIDWLMYWLIDLLIDLPCLNRSFLYFYLSIYSLFVYIFVVLVTCTRSVILNLKRGVLQADSRPQSMEVINIALPRWFTFFLICWMEKALNAG